MSASHSRLIAPRKTFLGDARPQGAIGRQSAWAHGVVGYHARLACGRSPVQFRVCPVLFRLQVAPINDDTDGPRAVTRQVASCPQPLSLSLWCDTSKFTTTDMLHAYLLNF